MRLSPGRRRGKTAPRREVRPSSPQASFWTWLRPDRDYALSIVVRDAILPELLESLQVVVNGQPIDMRNLGRLPELRLGGTQPRAALGGDGRRQLHRFEHH